MVDGDAAIRVLARNLDRFTCVCCPGDCELQIGYRYRQGCANVQRHLTSMFQAALGKLYRQQVHGLGFDEVAWRLFAESASQFGPVQS